MKSFYTEALHSVLSRSLRFAALVVLLSLSLNCLAEEMVTIPKSRLEELERKEAELAKLKGEVVKAQEQNAKLQQQHETDVAKIASTPPPAVPQPPAHVSPPM